MTVRESNLVPFTVLDPLPIENLGWEVRVFPLNDPSRLIGLIPRWRNLLVSDELNEVGVGEIEIPIEDHFWDQEVEGYADLRDAVVEYPVIFRVYLDGVERHTFIHDESEEDRVTEDGLWYRFVGPTLAGMLGWATILPRNWNNDPFPYNEADDHGRWPDSTYAAAIHQYWTSAKNRGCFPDMVLTFDGSNDSFGVPWEDKQDFEVQTGGTLLDRVIQWSNLGAYDWAVTRDQKFRASPTRGSDKSDKIKFFAPGGLRSTVKKRSRRELRTYLALAADGALIERADTTASSRWGRREGFIDSGDTKDLMTAAAITQESLRIAAVENLTREVTITDQMTHGRRLWIDFGLGDLIGIDDAVTSRAFRVVGYAVSVGAPDDEADYELVLQGWYERAMQRIGRKIDRLSQNEADVAARTTQKAAATSVAAAEKTTAAIASTNLEGLADVEYPAARADHDVLFWNNTAGKWQNGKILLADLIDVDDTPPQDGYVVTWDAAANAYLPKYSAGGGGSPVPGHMQRLQMPVDETPVFAQEFDEPHDLNVLPAGWSKILPSGTCDTKIGKGVLSLKFNGQSAGHFGGVMHALPAGLTYPWAVEVAYRTLNGGAQNYLMAGPAMTDGLLATSKMIWAMSHDGASSRVLGGRSGTVNNISATYGQQTEYFSTPGWRIERLVAVAANTWAVDYSLDGVQWVRLIQFTFTITPTHFGPGFTTWGGSSTAWQRLSSYDYVRIYQV